jgi:hypothetical protein
MPSGDVLIESKIVDSFRVAQVRGMFDVPSAPTVKHEWKVKIPIEGLAWQIGLIVGPSGSGKTTIGRRLFPEARFHEKYSWPTEAAIVDAFPEKLGAKDITQALSSVGFSSPPHWLKRFEHLSNGQKFRCELARLMLEDDPLVIFDEFTSVIDREAAQVSCAAIEKALRRRQKPQLIALSCHFDIIDWLNPDWVYNASTGEFARRRLRRRPTIELSIHPATSQVWPLFSGHHYLTRKIGRSAKCFVAMWSGVPVAFTSYVNLIHDKIRDARREHRTVVLPDFQGVGIGNAVSEWLGEHLRSQGLRFWSTTSHPAMIRHRDASSKWKLKRFGYASPSGRTELRRLREGRSCNRRTASFEYVGDDLGPQRTPATPANSPAQSLEYFPESNTMDPQQTAGHDILTAAGSPPGQRCR